MDTRHFLGIESFLGEMSEVAGSSTALFFLALFYRDGIGDERDWSGYVSTMTQSAKMGCEAAIINLAEARKNGFVQESDLEAQVPYVNQRLETTNQAAVVASDWDPLIKSAFDYALGRGVEQDSRKYLELVTRAADKGDWIGMVLMAFAFESGIGIQSNWGKYSEIMYSLAQRDSQAFSTYLQCGSCDSEWRQDEHLKWQQGKMLDIAGLTDQWTDLVQNPMGFKWQLFMVALNDSNGSESLIGKHFKATVTHIGDEDIDLDVDRVGGLVLEELDIEMDLETWDSMLAVGDFVLLSWVSSVDFQAIEEFDASSCSQTGMLEFRTRMLQFFRGSHKDSVCLPMPRWVFRRIGTGDSADRDR